MKLFFTIFLAIICAWFVIALIKFVAEYYSSENKFKRFVNK